MAWWNDYDRNYTGRRDRPDRFGGGSGQGGAWDRSDRYAGEGVSFGRYLGRQPGRADGFAYGYDYQYRRPPEESPMYGMQADQEIRRWARRYGYDEGYEISPGHGGGMRGRTGEDFTGGGGTRNRDRAWDESSRGGSGRGPQPGRGFQSGRWGWRSSYDPRW